jgi:NAD+ synthase (glutamine-hydrolysing)
LEGGRSFAYHRLLPSAFFILYSSPKGETALSALRLGLGQINSTVGDLSSNVKRIARVIEQAQQAGVDLVAFPELAITGYPPEDLLLKPSFLSDARRCLDELASACTGLVAVVGFVEAVGDVYNAAAVLADGKVAGVYRKRRLPNYGVFDEERYFRAGWGQADHGLYQLGDSVFGVTICEDIWYPTGPVVEQAAAGAELIVNINASPFHAGKRKARERMLATRAADNTVIVAAVYMVGGQDELVYDGGSVVFDERGNLLARAKLFDEDLLLCDLDPEAVFRSRLHDPRWRNLEHLAASRDEESGVGGQESEQGYRKEAITQVLIDLSRSPAAGTRPPTPDPRPLTPDPCPEEEICHALVLGTRDYLRKNGFQDVVIGLSGGIDSSLVAAIAVEAVGPQHVRGVSMPSRYSSPASQSDAAGLAENLGIEIMTIPIEPAFAAYLDMLAEPFAGRQPDLAEENVQARIRGTLLMALSNKFGWLVLTTGNKSEMATGYSTLYGDMAGGFAVLKDVPKTLVFELCRWLNRERGREIIPQAVIAKAPSAELRPDQKDEDSLPPYAVLDPILKGYVEDDLSAEDLVAAGHDPDTVSRVISLVDRAEYKRRQAPPGVKITPRAFGRDRRLPITNRYRGGQESGDGSRGAGISGQ